jgi:hypothetical protein
MFSSVNRWSVISAWLAVFVAAAGVGALSGMSVTIGAGVLWLLACVMPPAVTLMVWRGAPPPTVAEVLHAVEGRD